MHRVLTAILCIMPGLLHEAMAAEAAPLRDQVRLAASATAQVETDTLVAILYKEHQAQEQESAAGEVNAAIAWGVDQARSAGVSVETTAYRTYPVYRNQRLAGWRVNQSIRLSSTDGRQMAALLGTLQTRLSIQSLANVLSPARRRETEDALIEQALHAFQRRADLVAAALSRARHRIVSIEVSTPEERAQPWRGQAVALQSAEVAPPAVESGQEQVSVSVTGTIELEGTR